MVNPAEAKANILRDEVFLAVDELHKIQQDMLGKLEEAREILRSFPAEARRAEAYWLSSIRKALTIDGFLGEAMVTMQDTIGEIEAGDDGDDDGLDKLRTAIREDARY